MTRRVRGGWRGGGVRLGICLQIGEMGLTGMEIKKGTLCYDRGGKLGIGKEKPQINVS